MRTIRNIVAATMPLLAGCSACLPVDLMVVCLFAALGLSLTLMLTLGFAVEIGQVLG
jgi:hypothetical protein